MRQERIPSEHSATPSDVSLLRTEANGDDTLRIKDKNGETPLDLVSPDDTKVRSLLRKSQAQASIAQSDVANGEQTPRSSSPSADRTSMVDDDDDEEGSGSGSGSDDE